jgi:selenocysteine lyase/cysteine desulfurase
MRDNYYFDNAATSWPKPEVVYTTMDQFFRNFGVNPGRAGHELAVEAEKMIEETRRLLAAFFEFGGDPHRVVFTQNATDSLNIAFFGLLESGDHVITTRLEHNSVLRPLAHLKRDSGIDVTYVGRDDQGYVDPDDIRSAITAKTRMIVVNHASNVLGSVRISKRLGVSPGKPARCSWSTLVRAQVFCRYAWTRGVSTSSPSPATSRCSAQWGSAA